MIEEHFFTNAYWASEDIFIDCPLIIGEVISVKPSNQKGVPADLTIKVTEMFPESMGSGVFKNMNIGDHVLTQKNKMFVVGDSVILGFAEIPEGKTPKSYAIVGEFPIVIDNHMEIALSTIRRKGLELNNYSDEDLYKLHEKAGSLSGALNREVEYRRRKTN